MSVGKVQSVRNFQYESSVGKENVRKKSAAGKEFSVGKLNRRGSVRKKSSVSRELSQPDKPAGPI
jgi:hypothetical protein